MTEYNYFLVFDRQQLESSVRWLVQLLQEDYIYASGHPLIRLDTTVIPPMIYQLELRVDDLQVAQIDREVLRTGECFIVHQSALWYGMDRSRLPSLQLRYEQLISTEVESRTDGFRFFRSVEIFAT